MDIELVVTDLDGTLWHRPAELHERTRGAISELARRDVPVLVATGRRLRSTAEALGHLDIVVPAVVLNGALGVDLATGERFHDAAFTRAEADAVLAAFRTVGLEPCVYVDHHQVEVFLGPTPSTHPAHAASFGDDARVDDLSRVVAEERVLSFALLGRPLAELVAVRGRLDGDSVVYLGRDTVYGQNHLQVSARGMSKWTGVLAFCAANGIDADRVLAVGDGVNDIELLTGAKIAVAPEDAVDSVLAVAHHVIASAAEGGWAGVLDLL